MRTNASLTLHKCDYGFLPFAALHAGLTLGFVLVGFLAAEIGLVSLNDLVLTAKRRDRFGLAKAFTGAVAKEPSCSLGQTEQAPDLKCAHALLGRHHQMRRRQPLVQRHLGTLVKRPDRHRKRLAAGVALVEAGVMGLAMHQRGLVGHAAMRAHRAVRPQLGFHLLAGLGLIGELGAIQNRHGRLR